VWLDCTALASGFLHQITRAELAVNCTV
jgi:hypothetical protein